MIYKDKLYGCSFTLHTYIYILLDPFFSTDVIVISLERLAWHKGIIPEEEVWVKLVGDKGGGSFLHLHTYFVDDVVAVVHLLFSVVWYGL